MKQQTTRDFFATHPVFSLDEATRDLSPPGGRSGTLERLKYHIEKGRIKSVARGVYAVVPPGVSPDNFNPDPFLVAATARPQGVFVYHSALDLLGAAHSAWHIHTIFVESPRRPIKLDEIAIKFLAHPKPLRTKKAQTTGTRKMERQGRWISVAGPERTLVEGFRNPHYVGGVEELLLSASGFPVLNLSLLEQILKTYDTRKLWAATGWFLEQFQKDFHVPEETLNRFENNIPRSPLYLIHDNRGGTLAHRWNLILPDTVQSLELINET
ncbi:MAG: hypothetical protein R6U57_00115 [Anaerolineales bacterium]